MDIKGINHVGIRVRDLATTRRFYEQLGFEFVVGPVGPEPVAIMRHPGGVVINFILNVTDGLPAENVLMDRDEKLPGYTHVALEVPDLDAACAELDRLGIPLSGGPIDVGEARYVFIRDPDRNVLELNQPKARGDFKRSGH
jgi:lactoylglutathione lyase